MNVVSRNEDNYKHSVLDIGGNSRQIFLEKNPQN